MGKGVSTISIDWEDFGQCFGKYHFGNITEPAKGSIERQTKIILDLLDETENKATFFILGMLAQYRPELVKEITSKGHEIALHGMRHEAMFTLSPEAARADLETSLKIVEDISGKKVLGYRAPFFSVTEKNLYLLDTLAELGMVYDSSIFPVKLKRYGIAGFTNKDQYYRTENGNNIVELPMIAGEFLGKQWPVAGGGYIRLLPAILVNKIFNDFKKNKKNSMIYMHPYEFDPVSLNVTDNYPDGAAYSKLKTSFLNFRWNIFRSTITPKMRTLLKENKFCTCIEKANDVIAEGKPVLLKL